MGRTKQAFTVALLMVGASGCSREGSEQTRQKTNSPPVITAGNLSQRPEYGQGGAMIGIKVDLEVVANDPDGDALEYKWSVPTGTIIGSGAKVEWNGWNSEAKAVVTVVDGRGGEATWQFELQ